MITTYRCFVLAAILSVQAGEFVNLGFDDGSTNGITLFSVSNPELGLPIQGAGSPAQLLPGWSTLLGDEPVVHISYNRNSWFAPITPHFNIFDTPETPGFFREDELPSVSGKFALLFSIRGNQQSQLSIAQSGTVPPDAEWLTLRVFGGPITLRIDGNQVFPTDRNISSIGAAPGESELAMYDVRPFAGQLVDLQIGTRNGPFGANLTVIDEISFVIPEPGTQSLVIFAGLIGLGLAVYKGRVNRV